MKEIKLKTGEIIKVTDMTAEKRVLEGLADYVVKEDKEVLDTKEEKKEIETKEKKKDVKKNVVKAPGKDPVKDKK